MKNTTFRRLAAPLLAAATALMPAAASAKVIFTGYGDLRYNAGTRLELKGPAATLTRFNTTPTDATSRGFRADAVGLFASTQVQDDLQFLMDVSFKNIGNSVGTTAVQYAYLLWTPREDVSLRGGRVTLPFGYYNENRFYGFQRYALTAPVFQSSILGLPIADWGATARAEKKLSAATLQADAYVVNGYGPSQGQKTQLRAATVPGGISLAQNLRASDGNHQPAFGGRLTVKDIAGQAVEAGASYYRGAWDSSGLEPMYMVDAHVHAAAGGLDLLVEGLHIGVRGDLGFSESIGDPNWSTDGGFATLSYDRFKVKDKALVPFGQFESYRSRPNNGGPEREAMRTVSGGLAYKVSTQLLLKGEYLHLTYDLPDVITMGWLTLRADVVQLAAVVTF